MQGFKPITETNKKGNIHKLWLANNQINRLPASIGYLKNLQLIDLQNNPVSPDHLDEISHWLPNCEIIF
ncbi:leucine-rich repeat domain-containing protein [uncultured Microscilla sp.]|uniref:leucine-rich repeat domain-containing protein n=1 Tax=uncultured Microscilla sp. TaxID=432653 RepID=UPI002612E041|nr:leucine-rich repeat domain-containing protein [uncultured Microscilla sp.]